MLLTLLPNMSENNAKITTLIFTYRDIGCKWRSRGSFLGAAWRDMLF